MAGYGTVIVAPTELDNLIATLLKAAQRRAKKINRLHLHGPDARPLRMHYRRHPTQGGKRQWEIEVDGLWWEIAVWSQWIERDLPIVAEGFTAGIAPSKAVAVAKSLVARWHHLIAPEEELISKPFNIRTSVPDVNTYQWTILDWSEDEPLHKRLLISDQVLARWYIGDLPEEIAVEELHYILEYLSRKITHSGQNVPFPRLIRRLYEEGHLGEEEHNFILEKFNKIRKELRHRARVIRDDSERVEIRSIIARTLSIVISLFDKYEPSS